MNALDFLGTAYNVIAGKPKPKKKPSMIKDLIDCPDDFELHAWVEDGEITVKLRKRTEDADDE